MNAKLLVLVAVVAAVQGRQLNVFDDLVPAGIFDESIFGSFKASVGPQIYAYPDSNVLAGIGAQVGDLAEGAFAAFAGAENTAGGATTIQGSNSIDVTGDDTKSSVVFSSDLTASSNGPGDSLIETIGTGSAKFQGGNSVSGFDFSVGDFSESDTNAIANTAVNASSIASNGFAQSVFDVCTGAGC